MASPYATLRVYRKALPSGRSSLLSAWASELAQAESSSLACVRLSLCAEVPACYPFLRLRRRQLHCSLSRRIEAEEGDAFQACLEKRPIPEAALGDKVAKARRSRGSGGGATSMANTHDPAPAFAELAGFAAKTKNASQAGRLYVRPGEAVSGRRNARMGSASPFQQFRGAAELPRRAFSPADRPRRPGSDLRGRRSTRAWPAGPWSGHSGQRRTARSWPGR